MRSSRRFQGAEYRSSSLTRWQQVFAIRHRLRLDLLARAFAPFMVELFTTGLFRPSAGLGQEVRFRLSPGWKLPTQAEVERT